MDRGGRLRADGSFIRRYPPFCELDRSICGTGIPHIIDHLHITHITCTHHYNTAIHRHTTTIAPARPIMRTQLHATPPSLALNVPLHSTSTPTSTTPLETSREPKRLRRPVKKSQVVKLKMEPAVMDELEGCTPLKAESAKGVVADELRDARYSQDGQQGEDAGVSAKDGRVNDELVDQGATSSRDQNVLMDAGEDLSMIGKRPDDPNGNLGERPRDDPSQAYGEAPNDHVSSPTQENTAAHLQDDSPQHEEQPEDIVILYHTLVRDGALGCTTTRKGSVKKKRSCSRQRRSSSGQQASDQESSRHDSRSRSTTGPLPGGTPRKQSARGGCTSSRTSCATRPHRWARSSQRSLET